jgi:hypothetical protein
VNCGASVNEKNLTGVTPLGKAVESSRADVLSTVHCLLKYRADPSIFLINYWAFGFFICYAVNIILSLMNLIRR